MMMNALGAVIWLPLTLASLRHRMANLSIWLKARHQFWRYGPITETIKSIDGGVASEIEYRDCTGRVIGYWAYGSYDPSLPYRG